MSLLPKLLIASLITFAACAEPTGSRLVVTVAPVGLDGLDEVCWDLAVENATGTVWARGTPRTTAPGNDQDPDDGLAPAGPDVGVLCSDRYGNGPSGGITFVGACDASGDTNPDKPGVQNRVRLWVDGLYPGELPREGAFGPMERNGWRDPCPDGCVIEADCVANADTRVDFELTIMRLGRDGFLAAEVEILKYESCAGIYASCAGLTPKRNLLGLDNQPDPTAMLSFGCFFRANAPSPEIYYNTPTITCDQGDSDPTNDVAFALPTACSSDSHAVNLGGMQLEYKVSNDSQPAICGTAGGPACEAASSTFAVNTTTLAPHTGCSLRVVATIAGAGDFVNAIPGSGMGLYPYMVLNAQLTDATGAHVCNESLLDGTGGFLKTEYWGPLTDIPYSPLCAVHEPGDTLMSATGACPPTTCTDYIASTCTDGVRNGQETDVDCGGPCGACVGAARCFLDGDCASGLCEQETFTCAPVAIPPQVIGGVTVYSVVIDPAGHRRWNDGTIAASCKAYRVGDATHLYQGQTGNGRYRIAPAGTPYDVYCDMTNDGGGWTLALKVDGYEPTFAYDSPHWTTDSVVNDMPPLFDDMEAKYRSFNDLPFTELRVGFFGGGRVILPKGGASLRSLMAAGAYDATAIGSAGWLSILTNASIQTACTREGLNVTCGTTRARIGIIGDNDAACGSCESRLGLGTDGTLGGQSGDNTCGNEARNNGAGGTRSLHATGYVFLR